MYEREHVCARTQVQKCDDLSWLSVCLHLESTKMQEVGNIFILDWTILEGKIHPKSGICLLVAAHLEDMGERSFCF